MAADDESEFVPLEEIDVDSLPAHEVKQNDRGDTIFCFTRKAVYCNIEGCGKHYGNKRKDAKPIMQTYGSDEDAANGLLHHYRTSTHDVHKAWNKENDTPSINEIRSWIYEEGVMQESVQEYTVEETLEWQNESLKKSWETKNKKRSAPASASASDSQLVPRAKKAPNTASWNTPPENRSPVAMPLSMPVQQASSVIGQPGLRSEMMFVGQGPSNDQKLAMLRQATRFYFNLAVFFAFILLIDALILY